MRVNHAQAERLLKEHGDAGVPGFENLEVDLGSPDDNGIADLVVKNNLHASVEAFANAAGILAAAPPAPEIKLIEQPKIIGLPNVGQHIVASAGVWEEPDPERTGSPATTPSGTTLRWLYDGNEEDPVVIPEGDPHGYGAGGGRDLHVPAAAIGKSIVLRVTRGATTAYSEPFGPIEGGLTEFTFPAEPVRDTDIVSAEPASRQRSGASAPNAGAKLKARATTPSSRTKSRAAAKVASAGKKTSKTGAPKKVSAAKAKSAVKQGAETKKPRPAAARTDA